MYEIEYHRLCKVFKGINEPLVQIILLVYYAISKDNSFKSCFIFHDMIPHLVFLNHHNKLTAESKQA